MTWRTVVVSNRAKLDLKLNYLVIRQESKTTKIFLSEISLLLIESTATSITSSLLCELMERKIKVIFCDEKRNPSSELVPYYGSHDSSRKIREQIRWNEETKSLVWTEIVKEKIRNQMRTLKLLGKDEWKKLDSYVDEVELGDTTNREGHAAKVYFNSMFGKNFYRSENNHINSALNYGYIVLLSSFSRAISSLGYLTQIGIGHDNIFNHFNLSSDLIEPFRTLVDLKVYNMELEKFEGDEKMEILTLLDSMVNIDGKEHFLSNAITIYTHSIFEALEENDIEKLKFYKNEL